MPISSTTRKAGPFDGNGVTTVFPFDFKLFSASELRVVRACDLGVETDLVHVTDCTVTLNTDQDENPGGSVVLNAPLAEGARLVLLSAVPELQPVDLTNQGGFYPELVNGGLDRVTVQVQQLREQMGRSITVPVTSEPGDLSLPSPAPGQIIGWTGDGLTNFDPSELVSVVAYGDAKLDVFEGDGSTATFTLSVSPGALNNLRISIAGVVQTPGVDFSWSGGTTLTFAAAPPAGTAVVVQYQEALQDVGGATEAGAIAGLAAAEGALDGKADADLANVPGANLAAKTILAAGASVPLALERLTGLSVHPELKGAGGNGTTADNAALIAAANTGLIVDGGGRTYAFTADIQLPDGARLRNIRLKQVSASTSFSKNVLISNKSNIHFEDVVIDLNGLQQANGLSDANGLQIANCTDSTFQNVQVLNGGAVTGVLFFACSRIKAIDVEARDFVASMPSQPADDVCQGVVADSCVDSIFVRCGGRNLTANWPSRPTPWRRYSRGFAATGCSDCTFDTPYGYDVDQGVDFTGSTGNKNCSVINPQAVDCSTFGYKWANNNTNSVSTGGMSVRAGRAGFVCNSAAGMGTPYTQNIAVTGFMAYDTGANGLYANQRYGFSLISSTLGPDGYPAGITLDGCHSYDTQAVKTTDYGFFSEAYDEMPVTSTVPLNTLPNCKSFGHITGAVGFSGPAPGWHFSDAKASGTGNQAVPNNAFTVLNFGTDVYDPANLISNSRIYIKETGRYIVFATVQWSANATGYRQLQLRKNGGEPDSGDRSMDFGTAVENLTSRLFTFVNCNAGDFLEIAGYQNSGGALNAVMANSRFSVSKLHDLY